MPSQLRMQSNLDTQSTQSFYPITSPITPAARKQRMSLSQTYRIASSARTKLGREASRPDHDLRLLVGHANLLDSLVVELADAEREQEAWFNESVRQHRKPEEPRRVQWVDTIVEELEDSDLSSDSDDDSDDDVYEDENEDLFAAAPVRRATSPPPALPSYDFEDDDEEDEDLALTRVPSHQTPDLYYDSDSEDETMPPSPPQTSLEFTEKQRQAIATTSFFDKERTQPDFYQTNSPMITAY